MNFSKKNHELRKSNRIDVSKTLKSITTGLLLLITLSLTAQQGINYKAFIKDGGGNVVANQAITVQFIIYEGAALTNNVYQETHSPNTDANGLVIVNIGEGSVNSGVYAAIDWGADDHYLNVQIDTGGSLTDMGTTQFMAVPYALSVSKEAIKINDLFDGRSDNDGSDDGSSVFLGIDAGQNDSGENNKNIGIGFQSLYTNNYGFLNTAIGYQTLFNNDFGTRNTSVGYSALYSNTSGSNNTAIGEQSLNLNDIGSQNTATGNGALSNNIMGNNNTATGYRSLWNNYDGTNNTATGYKALNSNSVGFNNSGHGSFVLFSNSFGSYNSATGYEALYDNTEGSYNNAYGYEALFSNTTGSENTAIGNQALLSNTTGDYNTAVGFQADVSSNNLTNATALGANSVVSQSNSLVLGNNVDVGIGISAPKYKLHVGDGDINATNGSNTRMVVSDNDNNQRAAILGLAKTSGGSKVEAQLEANGSANAGPSVIVGSATGHPLYLRTGNLTRMTIATNGNVGINTQSPTFTLQVNGTAAKTGGGAWDNPSDLRLKQNIRNYSDGLDQLLSIRPVKFHYTEASGFNTEKEEIGVVAQDLQEIAPYMVDNFEKDGEEYLTVNNSAMVYMLINSVKELNQKIERLTIEKETSSKNYEKLLKRVEQLELAGNQ